jgi:hypothetical protein
MLENEKYLKGSVAEYEAPVASYYFLVKGKIVLLGHCGYPDFYDKLDMDPLIAEIKRGE